MSGQSAVLSGPHRGLIDWLSTHGIAYELHEHPLTYTARETARAEQVSPATFAKAVGVVTDDGRAALMVLDANDHLDLLRARQILGATHVRLMTEDELARACPGCDIGATPPVGELFGLATYVDHAIRNVSRLTFHAGSHQYAVHVDRVAWERALAPAYAGFAAEASAEPAWMRS